MTINNDMNKFFIVKEVVDQCDFDGLLDWGGTIGAYDNASEMISDAISRETPVEEIATICVDVFNSIYGYGHDFDSCLYMAIQIREALNILSEPATEGLN